MPVNFVGKIKNHKKREFTGKENWIKEIV